MEGWRTRNGRHGRNNNESSERQSRSMGGSWRQQTSHSGGSPHRARPNWSNNSNGQQKSFRESAQKRVFPSGRRRRGHAQSLVMLSSLDFYAVLLLNRIKIWTHASLTSRLWFCNDRGTGKRLYTAWILHGKLAGAVGHQHICTTLFMLWHNFNYQLGKYYLQKRVVVPKRIPHIFAGRWRTKNGLRSFYWCVRFAVLIQVPPQQSY